MGMQVCGAVFAALENHPQLQTPPIWSTTAIGVRAPDVDQYLASLWQIVSDVVDQLHDLLNAHLYSTATYSITSSYYNISAFEEKHYTMLHSLFRILPKLCALLPYKPQIPASAPLDKQLEKLRRPLEQILHCTLLFYFSCSAMTSPPFKFFARLTSEIQASFQPEYQVLLLNYFEKIFQSILSLIPFV